VILRPYRRSDASALARLANDKDVARFLPLMPYPYGLDDARQWINFVHRASRRDASYSFAIEHRPSHEIAGGISLKQIDHSDRYTEIGYWLGRKFWGRGLATEAVGLALEFSFEILKLHRVSAMVHEENSGSIRVLEKNGLTREGILRKAGRIDGRWQDLHTYGILRFEWVKFRENGLPLGGGNR